MCLSTIYIDRVILAINTYETTFTGKSNYVSRSGTSQDIHGGKIFFVKKTPTPPTWTMSSVKICYIYTRMRFKHMPFISLTLCVQYQNHLPYVWINLSSFKVDVYTNIVK